MANFDFKKEVAQAFNDFPQLRKDIAFTDLSDPSGEIISAGLDLRMGEKYRKKIKKYGSCVQSVADVKAPKTIYRLVIFNPSKTLDALSDTAADKIFTLDHEIGHCLLPKDGGYPASENVADAFAAIRYLQRFGKVEDLAIISAARSYDLMIWADWRHLSSPLLNQIAKDSAHIDFRSMSPAETIKAAKEYADNFTPTLQALEAFNGYRTPFFSNFFSKKGALKCAAMKAFKRPGSLPAEVGASLIRPFLSPEGAVFKGKHVKFSARTRRKLQERMQKSLAPSA